jgi:hypothetical protein
MERVMPAGFDLAGGFTFEEPAVLVPWTVTQRALRALVGSHPGFRPGAPDYALLRKAVALGGMPLTAGFQFHPQALDRLVSIRLLRTVLAPDFRTSYDEWQAHLETTLGPPRKRWRSDTGFDGCLWKAGRAELVHDVIDRFGLEESVFAWVP